ncbi:pentatricopeptide repeat-containing protein [Tanacetum coccineum]
MLSLKPFAIILFYNSNTSLASKMMLLRQMLSYKMDEAMLLYLEMNERVLDDMRAQGQMMNAFTYFCILNDLINMGHIEEALFWFHFVGDDGKLNSNISVYNFLIIAAFISKKPHIAMKLFEDLSVNGMKLDLYTYTHMIVGLCAEGLMKDAKHLLLKMEKSGIPPIDLIYNSFI